MNPTPDEILQALTAAGYTTQIKDEEPGQYYPPYIKNSRRLIAVISGQLLVWVNRDSYNLQPGSRLEIPPNALHWLRAGADGCRYILAEK